MESLLKKHNNIKLPLIFLFIISYTLFYFIIINDRNQRINLELKNNLHELKVHHSVTLDYFHRDAKTIQSKIINDLKVLELVKNSYNKPLKEQAVNREELYNHLLPFYKRIQKRGVLQFQFMFPDNTTFLRVHKPEKFNDDLTDIRYSYKYTNKTKRISYGFEQGKTSHSIRYVFPLFDRESNHIGAAEVALSTNFIQDRLVNSNKIHTHYIVNKEIFEVRAWKEPGLAAKYIQSVEHDDYIYAASSHSFDKILRAKEESYIKNKKDIIAKEFQKKEPFSLYIVLEDNVKILSFVPVRNIKDKKVVAYIVAHNDSIRVKTILEDSRYILITGFVLLAAFFYFFYTILSHRETLQKEVNKKTKELRVLNKNLEKRVEKEVEKNKKAQAQIYKSEKMAALGEMIGNIAHQWRQPLSVITTATSGLKLQQDLGNLTEDKINQAYIVITENAQYLSQTIDDFRDFIIDNKERKEFVLNDTFDSLFHIIDGTIKKNNLNVISNIEEKISIHGYSNELIQCFLNIFNNSKDALLMMENNRYIFINVLIEDDNVIIKFKDNGGGVEESILTRIFEPYYTTKHKSQGTGLGLSITYNIITHSMDGTIEAANKTFAYENETYTGLETKITLPLK